MHTPGSRQVESSQVRVCRMLRAMGLMSPAREMASRLPKRETEALMAVRPSPARSYTTPSRGWRSFQLVTCAPSKKIGPAQIGCVAKPGTDPWSG